MARGQCSKDGGNRLRSARTGSISALLTLMACGVLAGPAASAHPRNQFTSKVMSAGAASSALSDGSILIAGFKREQRDRKFHKSLVVARFSRGGKLDKSFGAEGRLIVPLKRRPRDEDLESVAAYHLSSGGTVFVVNWRNRGKSAAAVRVSSDGSEVSEKVIPIDSVIDPEGRVLSEHAAILSRSLWSGQLDTSFGSGGSVQLDGAVPPAGLAVTAESSVYAVLPGIGGVEKLDASGTPDASYGTAGVAHPNSAGMNLFFDQVVTATAIDGSGRLVASVESNPLDLNPSAYMARLTPTGEPDPSFGSAVPGTSSVTTVVPLRTLSGGEIVGLPSGSRGERTKRIGVEFLSSDGGYDEAAGPSGLTRIRFGRRAVKAWNLDGASDGSVVVTGSIQSRAGFDQRVAVARIGG